MKWFISQHVVQKHVDFTEKKLPYKTPLKTLFYGGKKYYELPVT